MNNLTEAKIEAIDSQDMRGLLRQFPEQWKMQLNVLSPYLCRLRQIVSGMFAWQEWAARQLEPI